MYICNRCKYKVSTYRETCSNCEAKNINYNHFKAYIIIALIIGLVNGGGMYLTFPGQITLVQVLAFTLFFCLCAVSYSRYNEFTENKFKRLIKEQGGFLLAQKSDFTRKNILIECGWLEDNSKHSQKMIAWVNDVAAEEKWEIVN